jgi:geranylgeranyl diphosphate synthase type I
MEGMNISSELKGFKSRIDPHIAAYFDTAIAEAKKEDELVTEALVAVKELALAGGKRLRPAFMYHGYLASGGDDEERILKTAVAVELLHLFLLVHDDIIDRDDMRHGIPTLHRKYADIGRKYFPLEDIDHFGMSIAIIMGDMLMAFGNDIIFRSEFPQDRILRALSKLQRIVSYTVIGQGRDIYMEYKKEASEEEILRMYRNKTARYTVDGPIQLGAILAGNPDDLSGKWSEYAIPVGVAFQIRDDILGVYGTEEKLGKPVGSDIEEGKLTLLVSRAIERGTGPEKKELRRILSLGSALTSSDIDRFRDIIRDSGSLSYAETMMHGLIDDGRAAIDRMGRDVDESAKKFFLAVADYLADREI